MASDTPSPAIPPGGAGHSTEGPHKLLGTLHVLFGSVLLLAGLCCGMSVIWQVAAAPLTENYQKSIAAGMKEQRDRPLREQIERLIEQEKTAETDEQRAELEAQRLELEETLAKEMPVVNFNFAMNDKRYVAFMVTDAFTGLILNAVMVIVGIGLMASKEWSRKLGLWVAWLKIGRLIVLYTVAIAVIVPAYAKQMGQMMGQMATVQQAGGPPTPGADAAEMMSMFYAISLSAVYVLMILFGVIYPIVSIRVLIRPKVKQACAPQRPIVPAGSA